MRLSTVAANKAGSINVFSIKAVPVMLPIIIGLRIVPEVMEPVAISIPIIMGISIPMVLAIVVTESIASVYVVLKLFIDMPTITMEQTNMLISDTDLLLKEPDRPLRTPIIIHMLSISTHSSKALLISKKTVPLSFPL